MDSTFINEFCKIDFEYIFAKECIKLLHHALMLGKTCDIASKLCLKVATPIINIFNNRLQHEHGVINIKDNHLYLLDIIRNYCYFNMTQNERLKLKQFPINNIDSIDIIFAPVYELFDPDAICFDKERYQCICQCVCPCHCHHKQNCACYSDEFIRWFRVDLDMIVDS